MQLQLTIWLENMSVCLLITLKMPSINFTESENIIDLNGYNMLKVEIILGVYWSNFGYILEI